MTSSVQLCRSCLGDHVPASVAVRYHVINRQVVGRSTTQRKRNRQTDTGRQQRARWRIASRDKMFSGRYHCPINADETFRATNSNIAESYTMFVISLACGSFLLSAGVYSVFHPSGVGKWVPAAAGKAKAGMAHSDCGWMCGRAGKTVKSLENTRHTWALCGDDSLRRGAISSVCTFTFTF